MKSGFIFAVLAAFGLVFGLFGAEATEPQYYTNLPQRIELAIRFGNPNYVAYDKVAPQDRAATDDALASGTNIVKTAIYERWPKTAARYIESTKTTRPYFYTFWHEAMTLDVRPYWHHCQAEGGKFCEARLEKWWANLSEYYYNDTKKRIVTWCTKTVKKQLRKEGKSFVIKDNYNPVQDRLDALTKALDAPKMSGLKAAAAQCGWDVGPDPTDGMPSDADCRKLMQDVFDGEIPFDTVRKAQIAFFLGVEEYNKFVKRYNGEE